MNFAHFYFPTCFLRFFLFIFFIIFPFPQKLLSQNLQITPGGNAQTIIEQLVGKGVTVSNITIVGNAKAYGKYTSNSFLKNGMLLTTGKALEAQGPNNLGETSTDWNGIGDTDLDNILIASSSLSSETFDACSISFDIKPIGKKLIFNYTFGSEEYLEYVDSGVNDIFAFLISGQNPSGGVYNKKNLALVPNTNVPVTIDNVNTTKNSEYFKNNNVFGSPSFSILQYDGFTINLKVEVEVVPCQTYRLELKIADVGDRILDSGVFIEKIVSPVPAIQAEFRTEYGGLIEGCFETPFKVIRTETSNEEVVRLSATGIANANDYNIFFDNQLISLPYTFNFQIGEIEKNFLFVPKEDNLIEPIEDFNIFLEYGCNFQKIDSTAGKILGKEGFKPIVDSPSVIYVCDLNQNITLTSVIGNKYTWTTTDGSFRCLDNGCKQITIDKLPTPATYTLTLKLQLCTFVQSITVIPVLKKEKEINIKICPFPSLLVETITETEERNYITQGRKPVYSWTTGENTRSLRVSGLAQQGKRTIFIKDEISNCMLEEIQLNIEIECNLSLYMPNAFTPNNDGLNDMFQSKARDIRDLEITIFNRWGELIHIIRGKDEFWDGYHKGKLAQMGVYVWQAQYRHVLYPEMLLKEKGTVTLLE